MIEGEAELHVAKALLEDAAFLTVTSESIKLVG
jgi:hypothetical protein